MEQVYTIAIHGGAGTILRQDMTEESERLYREGLQIALDLGYDLLQSGAPALEVVKSVTMVLEDNILFNAGRGSVFTHEGTQEMDASIMDGISLAAGAVAAVRRVRNPIELAFRVMKNSRHVFLAGEGAMQFARQQGLAFEPDEYFFSQHRYDQWKLVCDTDETILDHTSEAEEEQLRDKKFGTVGAVACDVRGNVAAATSTGGMTNKRYGRIGDSAVVGAGVYANNATCAISCTGHGEMFLRAVAAYDVSCLMEYRGLSLEEAMQVVVFDKLVRLRGEGGMIGVDAHGNHAMLFNSDGMYRGVRNSRGLSEVAIYK